MVGRWGRVARLYFRRLELAVLVLFFPALSLATVARSCVFERNSRPAWEGVRELRAGACLQRSERFGTVQASDVRAVVQLGRSVGRVGWPLVDEWLSQGPGHYVWTVAACARSSGSLTAGLLLVTAL